MAAVGSSHSEESHRSVLDERLLFQDIALWTSLAFLFYYWGGNGGRIFQTKIPLASLSIEHWGNAGWIYLVGSWGALVVDGEPCCSHVLAGGALSSAPGFVHCHPKRVFLPSCSAGGGAGWSW